MMGDELEIGSLVDGRYRIEAKIGRGGMGTIYRARHERLPRRFALKVLKPEFANNEAFVKRFLREAVAASQVVHPGVVNVTDFGQLDDDGYYIAMEYLAGVDLDRLLYREGTLTLDRTLDILIQLTDALGYCHSHGVLHRDLTTSNILLCTVRGRSDVVKLVDFGIARILGEGGADWDITRAGVVFGTPEYMSPERSMDRPIDERADIYSVGIIAFELVTGQPPWTGVPAEVMRAHIKEQAPYPSHESYRPLPRSFDRLVARCLAKDPANRFQTCQALLHDLWQLRSSRGSPDDPPEAPPAAVRMGALGVVDSTSQRHDTGEGLATPEEPEAPTIRYSAQAGDSDSARLRPATAELETLDRTVHHALSAAALRRELRHVLKDLSVRLSAEVSGGDAPSEPLRQDLQERLEDILEREALIRELRESQEAVARELEHLRAEGDTSLLVLHQLRRDVELEAKDKGLAADEASRHQQALEIQLETLRVDREVRHRELHLRDEGHFSDQVDQERALAQLYRGLFRILGPLKGGRRSAAHVRLFERAEDLIDRLTQARASLE